MQDGDYISVWIYCVDDGVWTRDGEATISELTGAGYYKVPLEIEHLSWGSLGWEGDTCLAGSVINIERSGNIGHLSFNLVTSGYMNRYHVLDGYNYIMLTGAPKNFSGSLTFLLERGPYSVDIPDVCSGTQLVYLPKPPGPQMTLKFKMVPLSPPGMGVPMVGDIPTFAIVYRSATAPGTEWLDVAGDVARVDNGKEMLNGELTISGLSEGVTYLFKAT